LDYESIVNLARMSDNERPKKPLMEAEGEEVVKSASGRPRRGRAIYLDIKTGEELYMDEEPDMEEAGEEEFDDEEMPDLNAVEDDGEEDEEDEVDPTPVDVAWASFGIHEDSAYAVKLRVGADGKIWMASGGGDDLAYLLEVGNGLEAPEGGAVFKYEGHTDSVVKVAFSHDGKYLATAGYDALVKIWLVSDASLVHTLEGPSESIETIEWHPKGPVLLAGCGDGTTWMWDVSPSSGAALQVLGGHAQAVNAARFTPDGSKIVTAGEDGTMRVWGPKTGKSLAVIQGHGFHDAGINCLSIHADNTLALTGGQDNNACLSNLSTGKVKVTLQGHNDGVEDVAWVASNPWAITGSLDGRIGIWDLNTGQNRQFIENGHAGITSLQSIGDSIFTADTAGYLRIWDARSSNLLQTIRASSETLMAFDVLMEHKLVATAGDDTLLKLYKLNLS
jgi:ribosome assembly protein SQT1